MTASAVPLWLDTCGDDLTPGQPLEGDTEADVAIVGGGLTGLWTAYYLSLAAPSLRIVLLERHHVGFGASGRNGGWLSALFPASLPTLARAHGAQAASAQYAAMRDSVDQVLAVASAEGIDIGAAKGGTVVAARSEAQLARARAEVDDARAWGLGEERLRLLSRDDALARLGATGTLGATFTPDCAAIHPGRLVRGLLRVVRARGVVVHEQTTALRLAPRAVVTDRGTVRARHVVRATEGYTASLADQHRAIVPVYSLVIATEPLPAETWERIGLARRETFSDGRHLIIYGQRTADDRLVFGGRGAPYRWGSRVRTAHPGDARVHAHLRSTLTAMLPAATDARITHAWGGALGIARDWHASVGLDRATGMAWAGGYVGDGLTTTHLAGRTLADLVVDHDTPLTRLPWVGHRSRAWEPEPLRWLGVNAGLRAMSVADLEERATGRSSVVARLMAPLMGGH